MSQASMVMDHNEFGLAQDQMVGPTHIQTHPKMSSAICELVVKV